MQMLKPAEIVLCSIVEAELYYGVMKSATPSKNLARLAPYLSQFVSLPFDNGTAREFGRIRADLAKAGDVRYQNFLRVVILVIYLNMLSSIGAPILVCECGCVTKWKAMGQYGKVACHL
jgi:tRNA(fMet)-specific endonuclease VapC